MKIKVSILIGIVMLLPLTATYALDTEHIPIQDENEVFDIEVLLDGIETREVVITSDYVYYVDEENGEVFVDISLLPNIPAILVFSSLDSFNQHLGITIDLNDMFQVVSMNQEGDDFQLLTKSILETKDEVPSTICGEVVIRAWIETHQNEPVGIGVMRGRPDHETTHRDLLGQCSWFSLYSCSRACANRIYSRRWSTIGIVEGKCTRGISRIFLGCYCKTVSNF